MPADWNISFSSPLSKDEITVSCEYGTLLVRHSVAPARPARIRSSIQEDRATDIWRILPERLTPGKSAWDA